MRRCLDVGMGIVCLFAVACGGESANTPDAGPPQPGTLTVYTQSLVGLQNQNKVVLIGAQQGNTRFGGICEFVTMNPEVVSGTISDYNSPNDPCQLGAVTVLQPGSYELVAGIYTTGQTMPDLCASATVDVDGDTTTTLPGFGACPRP